jgi:hypothetical protein
LDELVHHYGLPHRIITNLGSNSTITSSGSTARTAGSTFGMSQSPIHGPMDKSSVPMEWYSTPSRSDCTMLLTQKEKSGSRNCPMHYGGCVLNPPVDGTVTLFPSLRLRSYSTCRCHVGIASSRAIRRRHI